MRSRRDVEVGKKIFGIVATKNDDVQILISLQHLHELAEVSIHRIVNKINRRIRERYLCNVTIHLKTERLVFAHGAFSFRKEC